MDAKTELERKLVGLAPGMEAEIRQVLEAYRITWAETRRLQDTGRESRGDAPGKRHREVDTPSNGYSHSKAYSICVIPRYD